MDKLLSGTYSLGPLLGSGGMGAVYEGRHVRTNQRVAVKVIARADRRDAQSLHRFHREAKAVALLRTPHIVSVLDTGDDEELGPYTVMEFLQGRDLDKLVDDLGPLPPTLALKISAQVALGLKAAHAANIVHRDIKPANIFLESTGSELVVCRVLDFGIAKVLGELADTGLTNSGSMMGSPRFMSPEQARRAKHADHRADIWSLGVTIYKALSGTTPTDHYESMADLIISLCQEPARPLQSVAPWVAPEVASLVHAALAIDPEKRMQSVDVWLARVRELVPGGFEIHARDLVPLGEADRARIAERVAVPGYSTSGTEQERSQDALAATESVGTADVPTRVEGTPRPVRQRAVSPLTPQAEESSADKPLSSVIAPDPPRRVWTYAIAGGALSIVLGLVGWKLTSKTQEAPAATSVAASEPASSMTPAAQEPTIGPRPSASQSPVVESAAIAPSAPPPSPSSATPSVRPTSTVATRPTASPPTATAPATGQVTARPTSTSAPGELKGTFE